ncbi:MAG: class I SAM-dependent methyltransferase [Anaerosomatales bacterium]|nr:class I SAM-dependent methyltransferase [Coriobacteriia bacterium]
MSDRQRDVEPAADYDQMVNWNRRLAREAPFFEDLFARYDVDRIIDVGCGSAKHAIMFREWGHEVTGVDPSDAMLLQARENAAAAGVDIALVEGGFGELEGLLGTGFDAVLTLGNGLPHVDGVAGLHATLADFAAVLRPGGLVVLHLLNHARLIEGDVRMMPAVLRETPEGDRVFLKVLDYVDEGIMFDFVTLTRDPGVEPGSDNAFAYDDAGQTGWHLRSRRSVHTALPVDLLVEALGKAGFESIETYGDHSGRSFDRVSDESVIVVARRTTR